MLGEQTAEKARFHRFILGKMQNSNKIISKSMRRNINKYNTDITDTMKDLVKRE